MQQRTKIAVAVAVALHSMAAYAQTGASDDSSKPVARVEVTGSRIRQVDLETAQPVQVMTQEQIQKTGLVTVGDIVNNLTSAGTPAFSKGSTLTSNSEQGGQFINMRNLGANRLLVLVNGKRWTQTVDGYTDMSTIPASMIERIEILKDGASSIYGSDAIAGVVNFILKKSMEGGQLSIYKGKNELGDGKSSDYSLSYGTGSDKASMMFGLTHTDQGAVWAKDRPVTASTYGPDHTAGMGATGAWGRIRYVNPATGGATGINQVINHTGDWLALGSGSDSRVASNYHNFTGADADTYNSTYEMQFAQPVQMTSVFTKGSIELPHGMHLSTTAMYADRSSARQVAGYPLNSMTQSSYPVYIDKDSYYNPYGSSVAGAGNGKDLFFYRRTVEVPRVTDSQNRTLHIDSVLDGEFAAFGKTFDWNVGYNHSNVSGDLISTGNLNLPNLKKALGPSFKNASGVVQCGTAANPVSLTSCVPLDILAGPSVANPAGFAYVMSTGQRTYGSTVDSATADITGELFNLPAGAVGAAAGIEHRTQKGFNRPGQFEQSGLSTDLAGNATYGKYNVKEEYVELNVPLLKGVPLAQLLSVDLASRHSDYSNFGTTTNSKASFMWKPLSDLLGRGTYAQGFRAPTLGDTFGGGSQSFDSYLDPCDTKFGQAASNPAVAAACLKSGVPAGFRQLNQSGTAITTAGAQTPYPFNTGVGNDSLSPETATTKTLGFVYSPSWLTGFSASVDYFDIEVKNKITGVSAGYELGQCYVQGVGSFCGKFKRDPITGMITQLDRGNANLGALRTRGADLSMAYRFPRTSFGVFGLHSESTWVREWASKSTDTASFVNYVGEYGLPKWKSNLTIDWSFGNWSATLGTRFYMDSKSQCWDTNVECSNPGEPASWGTDVDHKGNDFYSDLSIAYAFPWKGKLLVGANNVFNKKPVVNYNTASGLGGDSSSSSVDPERPIDRFFYVRYNQSF
jgi:iron complex outermembrane receptor protein